MTELIKVNPAFFTFIGILIFTNIGAIGALIVFIFKCGVFVSETRTGIKGARDAAVRAHLRIDNLEIKGEIKNGQHK